MKLFLFIVIIIYFSLFDCSNQLYQRKLTESFNEKRRKVADSDDDYSDKKLMIVAFNNFNLISGSSFDYLFELYLKKIENFQTYNFLNFTLSVYYYNNTKNRDNISVLCNITNVYFSDIRDMKYNCSFHLENNNYNTIKVNKNFTFLNYTLDDIVIINEDNIIESSLATKMINNNLLSEYNDNLTFFTLYLEKIIYRNNQFILKGNLNISESFYYSGLYLILSIYRFNCTFTQYIENSQNKAEIKFSPIGYFFTDNLQGKIIETENSNISFILVFVNEGVYDLINYHWYYRTYIDLIGFDNYKETTNILDANVFIYFRGIIFVLNGLKNYIRFTARVHYYDINSSEQTTTVNVYGSLYNIDKSKNISCFNVTFDETVNKRIIAIYLNNDFIFSDDGYIFSNEILIISRINEINIINTKPFEYEEFYLVTSVYYTSSSLYFDFNISSKNLTIKERTKAYMNYIPMNNTDITEEIECYVSNVTTFLRLDCSSKDSVYTYINTLILKIPQVETTLRSLDSITSNKTFYSPVDAEGIIDYSYSYNSPEIDPYEYYYDLYEDKLTPGEIASIVIGTIFFVIGLIAAVAFFNKMPHNPSVNNLSELNLPNSSANIKN